jgi:GTPase KRas
MEGNERNDMERWPSTTTLLAVCLSFVALQHRPVMSSYKLVLLGLNSVGKTALTIQLCANHFVEDYDPTIEDSYRKRVCIDNEACLLEILDTAGSAEFAPMRDAWIRQAQGFIVVYSITWRSSFDAVHSFVKQIMQCKEVRVSSAAQLPMAICANKCDLHDDRVVSTHEGQALAASLGCSFFETSAKERINVEEAFYTCVRSIRLLMPNHQRRHPNPPNRTKKCVLC